MTEKIDKYFQLATEVTIDNMKKSKGGPFGAVVVRAGEVIVSVGNTMIENTDPTAHAELLAVRKAAQKLNTMDLSDCDVYATCEPCPMCVGAMMLANVNKVYYSSTKEDAAENGFSDMDLRNFLDGSKPDLFEIEAVGKREDCESLWGIYKELN